MSTIVLLLSVLGCAALFAVFGIFRRGRGGGCSSCTSACPSKEKETVHGSPRHDARV